MNNDLTNAPIAAVNLTTVITVVDPKKERFEPKSALEMAAYVRGVIDGNRLKDVPLIASRSGNLLVDTAIPFVREPQRWQPMDVNLSVEIGSIRPILDFPEYD